MALLGGSDPARGVRVDKHLPEIAALLDAEQFDLLTQDPEALLVVAGGAGCGKTTVGLHRLAWLTYQHSGRFRPARMLVLVFGKALARYISKVLPALGVDGVPVQTLEEWARSAMRRHFPELVANICDRTPAVVVRYKTHRIMIPMLARAARAAPRKRPESLFDELFTDRSWLRAGVEDFAPGAFSRDEVDLVHRWCTDQQFRRSDPGSLAEEEPACYDEEDRMILLRLYQLLSGRLVFRGKRKLAYDHLMVDEVQDFSPLELLVLTETVPAGSITLAGDPAQKITDNDFSNWSEVLAMLGQEHVEVTPLRVSYRSTQPITELARAVLGPLAPEEPLMASRDGAPVELIQFGSQGSAMVFLIDALGDLCRREPDASVAVLTTTARQADEAFWALRRSDLPGLYRVADQDFRFGPGIEVSDVAQTKGLEFDYVVLLDVSRTAYPDTDSSRHLLHVGISRAVHQLWLIHWSAASALLPEWLEPRLGG
jgi:DNA helicase-2/ATP-dependent DNA helicase PcrA